MAQYVTLNDLINSAIVAEDVTGNVYKTFERMFSHQPEVAAFWKTMADDENEHARILANVHGLVTVEALASLIRAEMVEKVYELKGLDIESLIASVHNLDDAYWIAYQLESSEVNTVFNFLTSQYLPADESYRIFSSVIEPHLLRLSELTRTFGGVEQCRGISAIKQDS